MARPPRLEFPSVLYHVTARGNERREIFRDDRDREEYLARLAHYREKFGIQLLAYCLMNNHVHLAIRTGDVPLSRTMAGLHSTYAAWFNRRHGRVGHLFQGRYKAHVVQEDRYLLALVRYIHRNPVRAGIVRRAADYRWSSDRFVRRGRGPAWLDVEHLLPLLDSTRARAIERYVEIVDGPRTGPAYDSVKPIDRVVVRKVRGQTCNREIRAILSAPASPTTKTFGVHDCRADPDQYTSAPARSPFGSRVLSNDSCTRAPARGESGNAAGRSPRRDRASRHD